MSKWLGKSHIEKEKSKEYPSLTKYFSMLVKFYIENQHLQIIVPLEYDMAEKFKAVVVKSLAR